MFKYLDDRIKKFGAMDSLAKLYASVGAGHHTQDDSTVMFRDGGWMPGDDPAGRQKLRDGRQLSSAGFASNPSWNVNHDGVIQQWEFGVAALSKLGAGQVFTVNGSGNITTSNPMPVSIVTGQSVDGAGHFSTRGYEPPEILIGGPPDGNNNGHKAGRRRAANSTPQMGGELSYNLPAVRTPADLTDSMADQARRLGGEWDSVNGILKDTGGIFLDIKGDVELLTTSTDNIIHDFYAFGQHFTDSTEKADKDLQRLNERTHSFTQELWRIGFSSQNMGQIFEHSFSDAFSHVSEGWKGVVGTFTIDFAKAVEQMVIQAEAAQLAKKLFGDGSEGSGGGWFGKLLHVIGIGAPAAAGAGGGGGSWWGNSWSGWHASGGVIPVGATGGVGEAGAEMVRATPYGAEVIPLPHAGGYHAATPVEIHHHYPNIVLSNTPTSYHPRRSDEDLIRMMVKHVRGY